jgi:hypothetical protein
MPATAKGPISHVVFDDKGGIVRVLTFQKGDHISDDDMALLTAEHKHKMSQIPHTDHTCPPTCKDSVHRASPPIKVSSSPVLVEEGK